MAYTDTGIGTDTILFIHGLGAWHGTWQKNVESLSLHTRCIAIDLPGNGCSSAERYDYSIDFFARCIIHFIYELGLQRVTLAGHSMGGQIALRTALLAPAQCTWAHPLRTGRL